MIDQQKLAVIHIVKKELALPDQEYRDILEKVAGVRSARDLNNGGFRQLMRYFTRSRHYRSSRTSITFRQKLFIRHLAEDLGWNEFHFRNFLKKYYHHDDLERFSKIEASKVIQSLKHILQHKSREKEENQD